ncbi:MAG TPA: hypothetical protein PLE77_02980 [Kiritimatiellia bacterium]|nr:hypothetical protein [Kiritimatiellia bacterium]
MKKTKCAASPNVSNTQVDLDQVTNTFVPRLNKAAGHMVEAWVEIGRLVRDYIYAIHPKGQPRQDPYRLLAAHPDCVFQDSQLRYYHACYELWLEMGGKEGAPKVSMTHFIMVLGRHINPMDKEELLRTAQKEHLSVSQFRQLVRQRFPKGQPIQDPPTSPIDWDKSCKVLKTQTNRLIDQLVSLFQLQAHPSLPSDLRDRLSVLVTFLLFHHLVELNSTGSAPAADNNEAS